MDRRFTIFNGTYSQDVEDMMNEYFSAESGRDAIRPDNGIYSCLAINRKSCPIMDYGHGNDSIRFSIKVNGRDYDHVRSISIDGTELTIRHVPFDGSMITQTERFDTTVNDVSISFMSKPTE